MRSRYLCIRESYPSEIHGILVQARLDKILNINCEIEVDKAFITALVERWRPETHTFHFPVGECTVTLEDVAVLLGLPIDGKPVVTNDQYTDTDVEIANKCENLLGIRPPEDGGMRKKAISLRWLGEHFSQHLRHDTWNFPQQQLIEWHARGYILRILGRLLFADKSTANVHYKYLYLVQDLGSIGEYSWGSGCLAFLYRALCRATRTSCREIDGCLMLLQVWAWYRLPYLAFIPRNNYSFPLASRWINAQRQREHPKTTERYRRWINRMLPGQFLWQPYQSNDIRHLIPEDVASQSDLWRARVPIICFEAVEWHSSDRVMRQFGREQLIPLPPVDLGSSHNCDLRNKLTKPTWYLQHEQWIVWWNHQRLQSVISTPFVTTYTPSQEYWHWYLQHKLNLDPVDVPFPVDNTEVVHAPPQQQQVPPPAQSWQPWHANLHHQASAADWEPSFSHSASQPHAASPSSGQSSDMSSWLLPSTDRFVATTQPEYVPPQQQFQGYVPGRMSFDVGSSYGFEAMTTQSSFNAPRMSFDIRSTFGDEGQSSAAPPGYFTSLISSGISGMDSIIPQYEPAYYDLAQPPQSQAPGIELQPEPEPEPDNQAEPEPQRARRRGILQRTWDGIIRRPHERREPDRYEGSGRRHRRN